MKTTGKSTLELGARHAEVVQSALRHWVESSAISESQALDLADTIAVRGFDWEKLSKYTLRLAVLCLFVAVTSIVFEKRFLELMKSIMALPPLFRATATAAIAVGVHVFAHQRSQLMPSQKYANEAIHGVGALLFALAAFQVIEHLANSFERAAKRDKSDDSRHARRDTSREASMVQCVALGLATVYAAVGLLSKSAFIWSCSMIVYGYCLGGLGGYMAGTYYIGMDSPLLFVGFGSVLIGASHLMRSHAITAPLSSTTRIWGLLYMFVSLWIMSIFGYDRYFEGYGGRNRYLSSRARMFLWSLIFFFAAGGSIWHGLRYDDSTTKGFGLTFLGINLYTKFFEYFWGWSKPVFFAVLAGTFAVIGKNAENIWNLHLEKLRG